MIYYMLRKKGRTDRFFDDEEWWEYRDPTCTFTDATRFETLEKARDRWTDPVVKKLYEIVEVESIIKEVK